MREDAQVKEYRLLLDMTNNTNNTSRHVEDLIISYCCCDSDSLEGKSNKEEKHENVRL